MTTYKIKAEELEKFLEDFKSNILKVAKGKDLLVSNDIDGTVSAPSTRKKFYRSANFALHPGCFKKESVSPLLSGGHIAFFFIEPGQIKFD